MDYVRTQDRMAMYPLDGGLRIEPCEDGWSIIAVSVGREVARYRERKIAEKKMKDCITYSRKTGIYEMCADELNDSEIERPL